MAFLTYPSCLRIDPIGQAAWPAFSLFFYSQRVRSTISFVWQGHSFARRACYSWEFVRYIIFCPHRGLGIFQVPGLNVTFCGCVFSRFEGGFTNCGCLIASGVGMVGHFLSLCCRWHFSKSENVFDKFGCSFQQICHVSRQGIHILCVASGCRKQIEKCRLSVAKAKVLNKLFGNALASCSPGEDTWLEFVFWVNRVSHWVLSVCWCPKPKIAVFDVCNIYPRSLIKFFFKCFPLCPQTSKQQKCLWRFWWTWCKFWRKAEKIQTLNTVWCGPKLKTQTLVVSIPYPTIWTWPTLDTLLF